MKKIGFVGLGIMGQSMTRNLMKAGYELFVFNRTAARMESLASEGATPCASPAEVGENCDLVITCVSDTPDVEEVITGSKGIAQKMKPGGIIVDCSTSSPDLAKKLAVQLKEQGIGILDAPVSGGPEGAASGALSIMVGGEEDVFERAKPVLEAMGKTITLIGGPGAGQMTKVVNQVIIAISLEAVAEGIALAKKSGLDAEKVVTAVAGGAAASFMMDKRGPLILKEEFETPYFSLGLHAKDMRIAMEAIESCGADLTLAKPANEIYQSLVDEGHGNLDHSAVYLHSKKKNNL